MEVVRDGEEQMTLKLSAAEFFLLHGALNEALEAFADGQDEFQTRTGGTYAEAERLMEEFTAATDDA